MSVLPNRLRLYTSVARKMKNKRTTIKQTSDDVRHRNLHMPMCVYESRSSTAQTDRKSTFRHCRRPAAAALWALFVVALLDDGHVALRLFPSAVLASPQLTFSLPGKWGSGRKRGGNSVIVVAGETNSAANVDGQLDHLTSVERHKLSFSPSLLPPPSRGRRRRVEKSSLKSTRSVATSDGRSGTRGDTDHGNAMWIISERSENPLSRWMRHLHRLPGLSTSADRRPSGSSALVRRRRRPVSDAVDKAHVDAEDRCRCAGQIDDRAARRFDADIDL